MELLYEQFPQAAFSSKRRYARGREVKTLHCPATVKGTKAALKVNVSVQNVSHDMEN
jgi:hypothetical protein